MKWYQNKMKIAETFNNYVANIRKTTSQNVLKGNTSYTNYLEKAVRNRIVIDEIDYLSLS